MFFARKMVFIKCFLLVFCVKLIIYLSSCIIMFGFDASMI